MTKLLSYLALLCLASTILADDCNNPLLTTFNFTSLGTPQNVTGLKYCKSLQNGLSCCSADTVNSFQDKAQALGKKLSDIVAARDKAIVETRDQIIPALQGNIQRLKDNSQRAMTKIMEQMGGALTGALNMSGLGNLSGMGNLTGMGGMGNMSSSFSTEGMNEMANIMQNMTNAITGNLSNVRSGFRDFQKLRSPCVVELLKLQSSAWCLACDPAWATKGVNGSAVSLSNTACRRIQSACFKFVTESASQSAVLAMKTVGPMIGQMATTLGNIATNGMQGTSSLGDLETMLSGGSSSNNASNSTMLPVEVPPGCTEANCPWICSSMFANGQIDPNAITAGGVQSNTTTSLSGSSRLLAQEEEEEQDVVRRKLLDKRGRVLAANEWNPDSDEAGVTVTFSDDPAGVSNAGLIKTGMICLLAMFAAFVF